MKVKIIRLARKMDMRGWFLKVLMQHQINGRKRFGEIYMSVANPGQVRAGHYHRHTTEWFCAVGGKGVLTLKDIVSGKKENVALNGSKPITVVVPPRVAHRIRNSGTEPLVVLAYADVEYNRSRPDTIATDV